VLVVGGLFPSIALYATAIALELGAERVDFYDPDPAQRAHASRLGAHPIEDPAEIEPRGYPITVDASLEPELLGVALRAVAPDGICTVSGMYEGTETPVPMFEMFVAGAAMRTGQPHVRDHLEPALELLGREGLAPAVLTDVLPWESAPEAMVEAPGKVAFQR
jgi:alcohol dehydrogenase